MAVEILMPELGESVHEGTVSRWLKQVGDFVKEDEPIVEIMTDKVNTELPSPASGVLKEIRIPEGAQVEVFHVMGVIEPGGAGAVPKPAASPAAEEKKPEPVSAAPIAIPSPKPAAEGERRHYTPVVRAIARLNNLSDEDLAMIEGTGEGGRVTKRDVEARLATMRTTIEGPATPRSVAAKPKIPASPGADQELVPLVGMRKMIADAMTRSAAVPVVSTMVRVDVTAMVEFREHNKESFQQMAGVKLTYTPFLVKALAETLVEFPLLNASLGDDGKVAMNKGVHIGVAVSLGEKGDQGLIVPVIKNCESKSLIEMAQALDKIAKRARANQLSVADVQGGTFTITNPGSYGAYLGTPMINAPQAGILGTYGINKEIVVAADNSFAVRSIMHQVLTYDHRLVDGLLAGRFLQALRARLETFDFFR